MSRGFVKDGDQEGVPVLNPRAFLPEGFVNYVTSEGLAALEKEREEIIAQRDGASGNEGDVRVTRNYLTAKLQLLEERISSAVLPVTEGRDTSVIGFGAYVTIRINGQKSKTLRIVGADEADAAKGLISYFSPISRTIYGHSEGDFVATDLPGGTREIEIVKVSYEALPLTVTHGVNAGPSAQQKRRPAAAQRGETAQQAAAAPGLEAVTQPGPSASEPESEDSTPKPAPKKDDPNEILPVVNERGLTVGHAPRWQCHDGSKLLHPVVHLHIYNSAGDLYLQKRPDWKKIQPGKWDTAVGGHVAFGEPVEKALQREALEEVGITGFKAAPLKKYVFESPVEKELVNVFKTVWDGPVSPSAELDGGRFWSRDEILANLGQKVFTPNFEQEFSKILK